VTDWALELAENANTYAPLGPSDQRVFNDRFVLWMGRADQPGWNVAQRFRISADELDGVRAEIHELLRARGRTACSWEVGSNATPPDLVERLHALGLVDDSPDPLAIGMVLRRPPAAAPPDVEVRRALTRDELMTAERIAAAAFGDGVEDFEPPPPREENPIYLAYLDGEPVARASAAVSEHGVSLFGGATIPEARGRGAYRALVAARWDEAVRRGTPLLVTQAGRMSRPILARLGFEEVCEIRILIDRFG
jgi:GNAT superfamily N-acetyltransferase